MKKASNDTRFWSAGGSATLAIGSSTVRNFASCTFFSITRLLPFSRITRSSLGRLKAAVCTPRLPSPAVNTTLTTRIGASSPSLALRYFGSIGSAFSSACRCFENVCSFARLGIVAQRDEGFERRLVVEPLVLVDLVRPDGRLDRRVELHPGDVAGVVVVRAGTRRRAPCRNFLSDGRAGQVGGLAQQRRGARRARPDTRASRARR